jgi:hypothetical protein
VGAPAGDSIVDVVDREHDTDASAACSAMGRAGPRRRGQEDPRAGDGLRPPLTESYGQMCRLHLDAYDHLGAGGLAAQMIQTATSPADPPTAQSG